MTERKIAQLGAMKGTVNMRAFTKKIPRPFLPEVVPCQEETAPGMTNAALATVVGTGHGGCADER